MQRTEALEVFDGAMLGDAGLYYSHTGHGGGRTYHNKAYFHIDLSGEGYVDWLEVVQSALECLGAGFTRMRTGSALSRGKPYIKCELWTKAEPLWVPHRERWYPNGVKSIPEGLKLTPRSLAHWFMGDGTSSYEGFSFAPCSLAFSEVVKLRVLLQDLGVRTTAGTSRPYRLYGSGGNNIDKLMDIISPYIVPSFSYKVRRSVVPDELRRK